MALSLFLFFFFFQAEDGIRDYKVTGVQTWCSSDLTIHDVGRPWAKLRGNMGWVRGCGLQISHGPASSAFPPVRACRPYPGRPEACRSFRCHATTLRGA